MIVGSRSRKQPLPDTESGLASFPELLATAIANAESRTRRNDYRAQPGPRGHILDTEFPLAD
jgi:hypothetical protein